MSTTSREVLQIDIAQVLLQTGHRLWTFYSTTVRCRLLNARQKSTLRQRSKTCILAFDEHCCHMGTTIKYPGPDRVKPALGKYPVEYR